MNYFTEMQGTCQGRKVRPTLVSITSIGVVILCLMVKDVYNRSTGASALGNGQAKFGFNSHLMKESFDHSKLHHMGEQAQHNHTHSEELISSAPRRPKTPAAHFPASILIAHCPSYKSGHSMVDQLISKKMNIHVKLAPCKGTLINMKAKEQGEGIWVINHKHGKQASTKSLKNTKRWLIWFSNC